MALHGFHALHLLGGGQGGGLTVWVTATDKGIARIDFRKHRGWKSQSGSPRAHRVLAQFKRELMLWSQGRLKRFHTPCDLTGLTPFTRRVLMALARAQRKTLSYKDLARLAGSPKAARAVGGAMARNPVPILIPCHLVLASGGGLGGFSGGLAMKKRLLSMDGCA
ncbi:MAG: methylated-DNA--[protein]-cysteine S-methyltransferase [Planctomycetota bacterium]